MWTQNFMIGQVLAGRYRIVQVLGAGGFGETYITADLHLPGEPQCVLKHLKPATDDPAVLEIARKLFQKEAETLQQLGNFDRIPRLLAYFEEKQEFYLVQELVRGHTLSRELISGQKWNEAAVCRMLREVLTILEFVHSQGVIHRDIKPENIMRRDDDGHLVLIDFGAIKQVRNQPTNMGTAPQTVAIGTPGYMSPEQARGNPRPNSDLYALGIIGIQAISGKNPHELIEDDATGELQWQHFIQANPWLIDHLSQMTRYHFRDRFTTASAALQALNEVENGGLTLPLPAGASPPNNFNNSQQTAATYVVSPAQPQQSPQPPRPSPAKDPRLNPPSSPGSLIGKLAGVATLLGVSGFGGYSGWTMFKNSQYEKALITSQCRIATPTAKSGNVTKVRLIPERNAGIIKNIQAGEKFLALQMRESFVEIQQRDGQRGWVFSDQIDLCFKPPTPTSSAVKQNPSVKSGIKPVPPVSLDPTAPPSDGSTSRQRSPTPSSSASSPSISPSISPPTTSPPATAGGKVPNTQSPTPSPSFSIPIPTVPPSSAPPLSPPPVSPSSPLPPSPSPAPTSP
jgi:serine/threonine protein kinase